MSNSSPTPVPCPQCAAPVRPGLPACARCGLRMVGPEAARLWQVTQQISALRAEADHLIGLLRQPVSHSVPQPYVQPFPGPQPPAYAPKPRRSLSGQQVMLGLGGLLILSAASFFLLVVWLVVGVVGQAAIMVTLTGAAVLAAAEATRRRLPAAAETFALVATGLLLIDLAAARSLDLAGLGGVPADAYWTGAGLLGGALLLAADRVVPRTRDGVSLRPVLTFRPAAAALLSVAGVAAVFALAVGPVSFSALSLVLAVLAVAGVVLAVRLDSPPPGVPVPGGVPLSAAPPLLTALWAVVAHEYAGLEVGLAPASTSLERYGALVLLLVLPLLVLLLRAARPALNRSALGRLVPGRVAGRDLLVDLAVVAALPALAIAVVDAHRWALVVLAWVVAVALVVELVLRRGSRGAKPSNPSAVGVVGWALLPALTLLVWALTERAAVDGLALTEDLALSPAPWWLPVLPALAWVTAAAGAVVVTRRAGWGALCHTAVLTALILLVRDSEPLVQVVVALVACAVSAAVAGVARALADEAERDLHTLAASLFAGFYGLASLAISAVESPVLNAAAFVVTGACLLASAAGRDRLELAYPGAFLVSAGVWRLLADLEVEPVELYSLAPFFLLAGIGLAQWRRRPTAPTVLTMGPALGVALMPTTWVAITEGDVVRLVTVTLLSIGVLVLGLARSWRAPVVVGGTVLLLVAITQGGPLLAHVHGFVTLFVAGSLLLAVGVAWEKAVLAGRRAAGWFSTLQ